MMSFNTNRFAPHCGVALALGFSLLLPGVARAQGLPGRATVSAARPGAVLLFPAATSGGTGEVAAPAAGAPAPADQQAGQMVTEALRKYLSRNGVSVILYDRRLPSVERAVAEGSLKLDDVAGPGDDPRKAQRLADLVGAPEYVTAIIEDYRYDAATRTASLNLTLSRNTATDGSSLGTAASPGTGVAPEDVARPRQEGSAAARAAEAAAEQTVDRLFPAPPAPAVTTRKESLGSSIGRKDSVIFGVLGGIVAVLLLASD